MATNSATSGALQSLGLGSGLDIKGLVTSLVTAETTPDTNRMARQTSAVATKLSATGQLMGALSTFQSSLDGLSSTGNFQTRSVTLGDQTVFTASADSKAAPGTYQIEVVNLAKAHQLVSSTFSGDGSAAVGTGNLTLTQGSTSFTINIESDHSSLNDIRTAINTASNNPGITATIVHGTGNTSQLVLTSSKTGLANQIVVGTSEGDGGLSALVYDSGNTANYTQFQPAVDASIKVAGVAYASASNTVTGAIDGVTINLLKATEEGAVSLTVANDTTAATNRIQSFVDAYNSLRNVVSTLGKYDSATGTSGPLLGDALLAGIASQTRRLAASVVPSASSQYNTLASIGVSTNRDGTLKIDSAKLTKVLESNFSVVSALFGNTDGIGAQLSSYVKAQLANDGGLVARNKALNEQQAAITKQQAVITKRQALLTTRYTAQFTAMDSALAQMQQTSSYLTQQFNILSKLASGGG